MSQPEQSTKITRTRTGCYTCRRRRKKCDETRPTCRNCERNSFICEGYQERVQWAAPKRTSKQQRRRPSCEGEASGHVPQQQQGQEEASGHGQLTNGSEHVPFPPDSTPRRRPGSFSVPQNSLPSLVSGVESPMERRLFIHFGSIMAPTLVLSSSASQSPFTDAVVQLALRNVGIMRLVFSVAACHLQRVLENNGIEPGGSNIREIQHAKLSLYGEGIRFHSRAMRPFFSEGDADDRAVTSPTSAEQIRDALVTTMLLCQYDTCEGGSRGIWRKHLSAAHALIERSRGKPVAEELAHDASFQLILDWYQYHEGISELFDCDQCCDDGPSVCLNSEFSPQEASESGPNYILIGPRDGLMRLMAQIANLRRRARNRQLASAGESRTGHEIGVDVQLLALGLEIDAELQAWKFEYRQEQHQVVGECFRWAAFIMLCSTIYSCMPITDQRVQAAVKGGLVWLDLLCAGDSAQTCSLFPIFVIGVAAVAPEDQQAIRSKLDNYRLWSGLGNADETAEFLQRWWDQRAAGSTDVNWWEWQGLADDLKTTITLV